MVTNWFARFVLWRIRFVEPKTLAKYKKELQFFNAKNNQWYNPVTPISADPMR